MIVRYDPETQGKELKEEEIDKLLRIKPGSPSFSFDEPELTEDLVNRMKQDKKRMERMTNDVHSVP